jgi:hypothetical protein
MTLSRQTHLRTFIRAFIDLWTGTTHTHIDQQDKKTEFKTCTLPFMKSSKEHNLASARVYIKNQTSIKVWPLRSKLSVVIRSFEPLTRPPTKCYNACFSSHLLDQRPMTWFPYSPNCTQKAPDPEQLTPRLPTLLKETNSHARMISNFASLQSFLHTSSTHSFYTPLGLPLDLWC